MVESATVAGGRDASGSAAGGAIVTPTGGQRSIANDPPRFDEGDERGTEGSDAIGPPPSEIAIGEQAERSEHAQECSDPAEGSITHQWAAGKVCSHLALRDGKRGQNESGDSCREHCRE